MRSGSLLALDWLQIDNRLAQEWHWNDIKLEIDWQWIGNGFTLKWFWLDNGLELDWQHRIGDQLSLDWQTDKPRVSASVIVLNGCVHCKVLASIFLDWLNIANPKLNLDWHRICAVLENCQYYWWVYIWDTCGIFICYDVGCMWDLKESEKWKHSDIASII